VPNVSDKERALAKVYAAAIYEVGKKAGRVDLLDKELRDLAKLVAANEDFQAYLDSPVVGSEARKLAVEKLCRGKYCDELVDSLQILNRNDRLGIIREVANAYHDLYEESMGRVALHVLTAVPLTDAARTRLQERISRATGKEVELEERIDESLIGGIVLQLEDRKFDRSIRRKLALLSAGLQERSSRELHAGKTYAVGAA